MVKTCDICSSEFRGFGTTCAPCRKTPQQSLQSPNPDGYFTGASCSVCDEKVYFMDKVSVDGLLIHSTCFRCSQCQVKLTLATFVRDPHSGKYFCPLHDAYAGPVEWKQIVRTNRESHDSQFAVAPSSSSSASSSSAPSSSSSSTLPGELQERELARLRKENSALQEKLANIVLVVRQAHRLRDLSREIGADIQRKTEKLIKEELQKTRERNAKLAEIVEEQKSECADMRRKNEELEEQIRVSRECKICLHEGVLSVMSPCGHIVCECCKRSLNDKCPFCRCEVIEYVQLWAD
jgi:hypothetical protein